MNIFFIIFPLRKKIIYYIHFCTSAASKNSSLSLSVETLHSFIAAQYSNMWTCFSFLVSVPIDEHLSYFQSFALIIGIIVKSLVHIHLIFLRADL